MIGEEQIQSTEGLRKVGVLESDEEIHRGEMAPRAFCWFPKTSFEEAQQRGSCLLWASGFQFGLLGPCWSQTLERKYLHCRMDRPRNHSEMAQAHLSLDYSMSRWSYLECFVCFL